MDIQSVASEMYNNFELKTRNNGKKFYCLKKDIEWQVDIIHNTHFDRMPDDTIYQKIYDFLEVLVNNDYKDEDEARDLIYEACEPDSYTSDLTQWLNEDNRNVYYLTEVLEYGIAEGFDLLAAAQQRFFEEIGSELLNGIVNYLETM